MLTNSVFSYKTSVKPGTYARWLTLLVKNQVVYIRGKTSYHDYFFHTIDFVLEENWAYQNRILVNTRLSASRYSANIRALAD